MCSAVLCTLALLEVSNHTRAHNHPSSLYSTVPGAVTIRSSDVIQDISSVTIKWNPPSNIGRAFTDIITYTVRNLNSTNSTTVNSSATVTNTEVVYMLKIPQLYPNTTVNIKITAVSAFSAGPSITFPTATLPIRKLF